MNNNVAESQRNGRDVVVMGNGLAFGKKIGDKIEEEKIEKTFELSNDTNISARIYQLIEAIPFEYWDFTFDVEKLVFDETHFVISSGFYISLLDHIYTAVKRAKEGIHIPNFFTYDIRKFYEPEFVLAKKIVACMNERFNVITDENEDTFIVMHLIDAQFSGDIGVMNRVIDITNKVLLIVGRFWKNKIDTESIEYERFKTHLRYFIERAFANQSEKSKIDGVETILADLGHKYPIQYACVESIKDYIQKELNILVNKDEEFYIMLHLIKIMNKQEGTSLC